MQTRRILLGASVFAAAVIATSIIGPYETGERMSFVSRVGYWSSLIFCAGAVFFAIRYGARWAMDRIGFDDYRTEAITAAIAAIGFALPLPFVATQLNAYLTGQESALPFWPIYGSATALSLLIWCVMLVRRVTERWDIVPCRHRCGATGQAVEPCAFQWPACTCQRYVCSQCQSQGVEQKNCLSVAVRDAGALWFQPKRP